MATRQGKNAAAQKPRGKGKTGKKKKRNVYMKAYLSLTAEPRPVYVEDMRDLLVAVWKDEKAMAELAIKPTAVFKRYGLLPQGSKTVIVPHFQEKGRFDVVIPPKQDLNDEDLLMLAHHLIRCCAAC